MRSSSGRPTGFRPRAPPGPGRISRPSSLDLLDDDTLALLEIDEKPDAPPSSTRSTAACFLARRKEIYERPLSGKPGRGGDRAKAAPSRGQKRTTATHRGLRRGGPRPFTPFLSLGRSAGALRIGEKIVPELREELAITAIAYREGRPLHHFPAWDDDEQQTRAGGTSRPPNTKVRRLSDIPSAPRNRRREEPPEEPAPNRPRPEFGGPVPEKGPFLERVPGLSGFSATERRNGRDIVAWLETREGTRAGSGTGGRVPGLPCPGTGRCVSPLASIGVTRYRPGFRSEGGFRGLRRGAGKNQILVQTLTLIFQAPTRSEVGTNPHFDFFPAPDAPALPVYPDAYVSTFCARTNRPLLYRPLKKLLKTQGKPYFRPAFPPSRPTGEAERFAAGAPGSANTHP